MKIEKKAPKINDDLVYRPKAIKIDNFWAEMAEYFKALAKLCEEKSENRKESN